MNNMKTSLKVEELLMFLLGIYLTNWIIVGGGFQL